LIGFQAACTLRQPENAFSLFANAKAAEYHAQQIIGGKFACNFAARVLREAQVFGKQFKLVVAA
jgi:hypothetical protein